MAKFQSPLLGYNNNVRHKNRVFHIQTEDSGVNHPHIITHLFMDGGRILKSVKKSYAEHVGAEGMSEIVRGLMKEQHKAMFIALRDGQFDALVDGGAPAAAPAPAAAATAAPAHAQAVKIIASPSQPPKAATAAATTAAAALDAAPLPPPASPSPSPSQAVPATRPETAVTLPEMAPPTVDDTKPRVRPSAPAAPAVAAITSAAASDADDVPMTTRQPEPPAAPSGRELTLDLDAIEQAAQDALAPAASLFTSNDLPPPPKNLFAKERGTGAYKSVESEPPHRVDPREEQPSSPPPASQRRPPQRPAVEVAAATARTPGRAAPAKAPAASTGSSRGSTRAPAAKPAGDSRYAPARPAAIFGSSQRPAPQSQSLFSDELISDKSLDEVILSYLAEDLEPPRRK